MRKTDEEREKEGQVEGECKGKRRVGVREGKAKPSAIDPESRIRARYILLQDASASLHHHAVARKRQRGRGAHSPAAHRVPILSWTRST